MFGASQNMIGQGYTALYLGHLVHALLDDPHWLSNLLHSDQIPIVGVAVNSDGDVKVHLKEEANVSKWMAEPMKEG